MQKPDRPIKVFGESSDRSKRCKTKDLQEQVPADELTYVAHMNIRASGNSDISKFIKDITVSQTLETKFRKAISNAPNQVFKKHTPSKALAIFVEGEFTRKQWEILHSANKNIYPCYYLINNAKKSFYPREESIRVTEICAEIELQDLLDRTSMRLCK